MGIAGISVVADTGPLLHLAEIDCLSLLSIFETIHIPEAVWQECQRQGQTFQTALARVRHIRRHPLYQPDLVAFIQANNLTKLHFGERECLYLCQQDKIPIVLTDDLAVRDAAKHLQLTPVGSLGIIVRAYHLNRISIVEAERSMLKLYDISSLFVTRTIVEMAIQQLHA